MAGATQPRRSDGRSGAERSGTHTSRWAANRWCSAVKAFCEKNGCAWWRDSSSRGETRPGVQRCFQPRQPTHPQGLVWLPERSAPARAGGRGPGTRHNGRSSAPRAQRGPHRPLPAQSPAMAEEARAAARHNWPEPLQLERRNLLTARRRWLRRTLQCRVPLQRLLVVARLREEVEAEEVAGYHRELFEVASEYEQVSGLLLLSSSQVLHVVESCCSTIHFLIRALASLQNQGPR